MSTSSSHYFREAIRGAERCGLDSERLLAEIGATRIQIEDPTWRGKSEQLARLVQLVWLALGDEFMGFTERRCKAGTFAMIVHGIINENSLERALTKAVLFYDLVTDDIKMRLEPGSKNTLALNMVLARPELDPAQYMHEFWLSVWYRLISWLAGSLAPLEKVTFSYDRPVVRIEEFKYMFPAEYEFNAPVTSLVFHRDFLQNPIVRSKHELKSFLSVAPHGFMSIPTDVFSYSRQIRNLILPDRRLPLEFPEFEEVAALVGMGAQSLRRKLRQEGSSYRGIMENIRRDIAIEKLVRGNNTVADLAELLGYSETRAFTRAFRQWTGMSPARYRDHFRSHVSQITVRP
ncbi:MAG: AraC family transcriptional regulator ligand-binding domain-containing protein [Afipia sp.]|nr:AraC family transcriptional regulator ligand-binding domain-containing protein [Afipia sp.]